MTNNNETKTNSRLLIGEVGLKRIALDQLRCLLGADTVADVEIRLHEKHEFIIEVKCTRPFNSDLLNGAVMDVQTNLLKHFQLEL